MTPITVASLVRSFAALLMADSMSARKKQLSIILMAVFLFEGYAIAHVGFSLATIFDNLLSGLEAGLSALGIYHLTDKPKEPLPITPNDDRGATI